MNEPHKNNVGWKNSIYYTIPFIWCWKTAKKSVALMSQNGCYHFGRRLWQGHWGQLWDQIMSRSRCSQVGMFDLWKMIKLCIYDCILFYMYVIIQFKVPPKVTEDQDYLGISSSISIYPSWYKRGMSQNNCPLGLRCFYFHFDSEDILISCLWIYVF